MKPIPPEKMRAVIQLRLEQNLSTPRIARKIGICNQSAYRILRPYPWQADRGNTRCSWLSLENQRLRELYPEASWANLKATFSDRSLAAIAKQASALGIKRVRTIKRDRPLHPLCQALRDERERLGWTRVQLAKKIGYHMNMILCWELGKHRPTLSQFIDWANGIGFDVTLQKTAALALAA